MREIWGLAMLLVVALLISGCNGISNEITIESSGNPTAEEILSENPEADIFMLGDLIYSNAENIDWVSEQPLTIGEEIAEIAAQTSESDEFENGTATRLPIGTKIHEATEREDIYIAVVDGEEIPYLSLVEG